ncbi:MAG: hypothetical protein GY953_19685, partial [bacterium]|nr:hypothetical protein [bacterium]
ARALRPATDVRYVDDFLLFGDDKEELSGMRERMGEFLGRLRLRIHPGKSRVYRTGEGVSFLGWRIFPNRLRLVRGNVVRFRRRLEELHEGHARGSVDREEVETRVAAWIAHASHGDTWRLQEQVLGPIHRTCACRTATGTNRRTGTITSGFVACGK